MVTGDYSITSLAIAKQVGIFSDTESHDTLAKFREKTNLNRTSTTTLTSPNRKSIILNGSEIDRLSKDDWKLICDGYKEIILSRASPSHKLICVKAFQENNHCVLMAGDGINDVPALKQADLSVSMNSGSKLATDISEVVLLNNSFSTITDLFIFSRQLLLNYKKIFLYFIVSSVFSHATIALLTVCLGIPQLITNLQMTVVSAFTDVLPSISFVFEKTTRRRLKLFRCDKLIDRRLLAMGFLFFGPLTVFFAYLSFFLYFRLYTDYRAFYLLFKHFNSNEISPEIIQTAQSVAFFSIVIIHSFGNLYSIRTRSLLLIDSLPFKRPFNNWYLLASSISIWVLMIVLVRFSVWDLTDQMPFIFYFIPFGFSILIIALNETRKYLINRYKSLNDYLSW